MELLNNSTFLVIINRVLLMKVSSFLVLILLILMGCSDMSRKDQNTKKDDFKQLREDMVNFQIKGRGVKDKRVLDAMTKVPRHLFVPENLQYRAYEDEPLPIGFGQTISQPYIVAYMTEQIDLDESEKVLEIGTGSGYQAAILGEVAKEVYTIEIVPELGEKAREVLQKLDYANVQVKIGDGYKGWPEVAPFDAIIVTAAPDHVPQPLVDQLKIGGRMMIPVGEFNQDLILLERTEKGIERKRKIPVRFVPMTGEAEEHD
jgi:protein-L-isoaspartate(D-aspartate) O-methyltransferase